MNHRNISTSSALAPDEKTPAPDENASPNVVLSKERRKLDALFSIKRTRNGIGNAINILTESHKVLSDPNPTKREMRSVLSDIKNIVMPYGNHAGQVIESETKQLHNIASLQYSFDCDEVDQNTFLPILPSSAPLSVASSK
jgi:hypothetical protein